MMIIKNIVFSIGNATTVLFVDSACLIATSVYIHIFVSFISQLKTRKEE